MKRSSITRIAIVSALLGTTVIGCSANRMYGANSAATLPAATQEGAAVFARKAEQKLAGQDFAEAIDFAERAVAADPRGVEYRVLLGKAYMAGGRFSSAAQSYQDAIDLGGSSGRNALNLALARIAEGKNAPALDALEQARPAISAADYGLALALAGQPEQAIGVLEEAARTEGATARERQNLALSYALAGRWREARVTAAQDVSPADLPGRIEQWAMFVQTGNGRDQVASLLNITPHEDPGQPTRLALANFPAQALADATPVAPTIESFAPAPMTESQFAAASDIPSPTPSESYSPALESASAAPQSAPAPDNYPRPVAKVAKPGGYVVQIGAFSRRASAELAWNRAVMRHDRLAMRTSMMATARGGSIYRLSVGGFHNRAAANALCAAIRQEGSSCFVRSTAGDKPVQWAVRGKGKARLAQVASR